jgi:hypothetical protein
VFYSEATNLITGDTNAAGDCFLRDRLTLRTTRISTGAGGVESDSNSYIVRLSRNARTIAFDSFGSNLVPGDTNSQRDVFVRRWPVPVIYCTPKTNSLGCASAIDYSGVPMASFPQGFVISASGVLNQKFGVLLYSTLGSAANPFHGATLCIQAPFHRTAHQLSGGSTSGSDCTGSFTCEFNALIASGANPALIAGQQVWTQYWSRDPGFTPPLNFNLTDALAFVIDP